MKYLPVPLDQIHLPSATTATLLLVLLMIPEVMTWGFCTRLQSHFEWVLGRLVYCWKPKPHGGCMKSDDELEQALSKSAPW